MKTMLKLVGITAVAATLFAFKKKRDYEKVVNAMKLTISNIRNLRIRNMKFYFDFDLTFHNPTDADMDIYTAGLITLKKVSLLYQGTLIGNAYSNTTEFSLPAGGYFTIKGIQIECLMLEIINKFATIGLDTNLTNYQVIIEIQAFGQTFTIEQ